MNIMNLYVYENRSMSSDLSKPIMLENLNVDTIKIHIPQTLGGVNMSTWAWWFVYQNAKREKYSVPLTLEMAENDEGEVEFIATVFLNYGYTGRYGTVSYALEAIRTNDSGKITGEWHTRTYKHDIIYTLQGNQAQYAETEADVISALLNRVNELITSGAEIAEIAATIEAAAETAQEVIDSIPSDYSALSRDVETLKADLDDLDDRVEALEAGGGSSLSSDFSTAMITFLSHLTGTFDDEHGQDYIDAVIASLDNSGGGGDDPDPSGGDDPDPSGGDDEARIPSDYQEVEYIESTGYSYFKIEKPAGALPVKIETGLHKTTQATSEQCVIMASEGNTTCWELGFNNVANTIFAFSSQSAKVSNAAVYGNKIDVVAQFNASSPYKQLSVTANETTLTAENTNANSAKAGSTNAVLNFFAAIGSTTSNKADCRMYYCKIYDASNNLVVDLVPCYRKSDDVAGMYDLVGEAFYKSMSTTNFSKGDNV